MTLSHELLRQIYDYVGFEESCMLDKTVYQHALNNVMSEFYCGTCTDESCGHENANNLLLYEEVYRLVETEDGRYTRLTKKISVNLCKRCLSIGLMKFKHKYKHVPYLRGEGEDLMKIIKELRKMSSKDYLQCIEMYKKMGHVVFDKEEDIEMYKVNYSNHDRYENAMIKIS